MTKEFMGPKLDVLVDEFQHHAHVDPNGMGLPPVPPEDVTDARAATLGSVVLVAFQKLLDEYPKEVAVPIASLLSQDMRDAFIVYMGKLHGITPETVAAEIASMEGEGLPPTKES